MSLDRPYRSFTSRSAKRNPQDSPSFPTVEENGLPSLPKVIDPSLSPQQCAAIAHLVSGKSLSSTATLLGIDRKTLYNWRQLPAFQHALHELCVEACETAAMRMRNLLLRGTHKLVALLEGANRFDDLLRLVSNKRIWDFAHVLPKTDDESEHEEETSTETVTPVSAEPDAAKRDVSGAEAIPPDTVRRERDDQPSQTSQHGHAERSEASGSNGCQDAREVKHAKSTGSDIPCQDRGIDLPCRQDTCVARVTSPTTDDARGRGKPRPNEDANGDGDAKRSDIAANPSAAAQCPSPAP